MRLIVLGAVFLVSAAMPAAAQRWKDIGTTSSGNVVSVDPKSVRKTGDHTAAIVRVVFTTPVKAARGTWKSSRSTATFDCTRRYLAVKENVYYSDEKSTKVVERSVNKMPGYGPGLGGSLGGIAVDYICGPKK